MPTPTPPAASPQLLWDQLVQARAAVSRSRRLPMDAAGTTARHDLLAALEAYVACLEEHGRPIPYALRDELRLQQRTLSADRQLRYAPPTRYGSR
jgi:hypothetical protein